MYITTLKNQHKWSQVFFIFIILFWAYEKVLIQNLELEHSKLSHSYWPIKIWHSNGKCNNSIWWMNRSTKSLTYKLLDKVNAILNQRVGCNKNKTVFCFQEVLQNMICKRCKRNIDEQVKGDNNYQWSMIHSLKYYTYIELNVDHWRKQKSYNINMYSFKMVL